MLFKGTDKQYRRKHSRRSCSGLDLRRRERDGERVQPARMRVLQHDVVREEEAAVNPSRASR